MTNFLYELGKLLYPQASDQEINSAIQELKRAHPRDDEQTIALGVIDHFISGGK